MKSTLLWCLVGTLVADPSSLWPKPSNYTSGNSTVVVSRDFYLQFNKWTSRVNRIAQRYSALIRKEEWIPIVPLFKNELKGWNNPQVQSLSVEIENFSDEFDDKTDESYTLSLEIKNQRSVARLKAKTIFGAIHGLESFTQMIQYSKEKDSKFFAKAPFTITDAPKFPHRGLLLDTARNYFPIKDIKRTIDSLGWSKMNVLHWHLTDSNTWAFKSKKRPLLWQKSALVPDQLYTFEDIRELVEYGLDRGVRIIPELEAPAHAWAIGKAYPELGTCMDVFPWWPSANQPPSGQIDPTNPLSVAIVNDIIDEMSSLFKDKYFHLSGDEVKIECWKQSPKIEKYVKDNNLTYNDLIVNFASGMYKQAQKNKKSVMVYQEILLNHNVTLPKDSLIHAWLKASDTKKIVEQGYRVIASSYDWWYLDCGRGSWMGGELGKSWCDPYKGWQTIYSYDLLADLNPEEQKLVAGGEVAMWAEQADPYNFDPLVWPRASVAGEVLWAGNRDENGKVYNSKLILDRLNNFRFRLTSRGIHAEALQPLWCVLNPGHCPALP